MNNSKKRPLYLQDFPKSRRLGPYEIPFSIGASGMGEVFRARDTRLHRDVVTQRGSAALLAVVNL